MSTDEHTGGTGDGASHDAAGGGAPHGTAGDDRPVTAVVGRRAVQGGLDALVLYGVALGLFTVADQGYRLVRDVFPGRLAPGDAQRIFVLLDLVDTLRAWFPAVLAVWALLYLVVVPWLLRGRTPGMLVMRLRVVGRDGTRPSVVAHLLRAAGAAVEVGVPALLLWSVIDLRLAAVVALLVPLLLITITAEHTRCGDVIARTRVVWAPPRGRAAGAR